MSYSTGLGKTVIKMVKCFYIKKKSTEFQSGMTRGFFIYYSQNDPCHWKNKTCYIFYYLKNKLI